MFVGVILTSSVLALTYLSNVIRYMYLPPAENEASVLNQDTDAAMVSRPEGVGSDDAPMTMLVPMLILALGTILLGLFNGDVVSRFIDPAIPARLLR